MEKIVYINQLKKLIKKFHPDLCTDTYLEKLYNEITIKLVNKLNQIKTQDLKISQNNNDSKNNKNGLKIVREQDYVYYKLGIKYYKNIHPNYFYKRNADTTFETKTFEEILTILNNIHISFSIAEYYFSNVIENYPQSLYYEDSKDKIKLLKKLFKSYDNVVIEESKVVNSKKFMEEMGIKIL